MPEWGRCPARTVVVVTSDSDAHTDIVSSLRGIVDNAGAGNRVQNLLRHESGAEPRGLRQQDHEFLAPISSHEIRGALACVYQGSSDVLQTEIPLRMPV